MMAPQGADDRAGNSVNEFKQQAVRLVIEEGKSVGTVAQELDLVPSGSR